MDRRSLRQEDVRIASPCPASWDEMLGDEQVRYCHHCAQAVYNLSAMTGAEAKLLLKAKQRRICVRYFVRNDGAIMTTDCPVGLARIRRIAVKRISAVAAMLLSLLTGMPALIFDHLLNREINKRLQPPAVVRAYSPDTQPTNRAGVTGKIVPQETWNQNAESPLRLTIDMIPPELIYRVEPSIPAESHIQAGIAILEVVINKSGTIDDARILRSLSPALDHAALNAIRLWRYKPARLNGYPVSIYYTIAIRYCIS